MSDLAQAIVNLGKAAQHRTSARRELRDATELVAAAIRKQLRAGDIIDGIAIDGSPEEGADYSVNRVCDARGRVQQVLCRGTTDSRSMAVLEPIETDTPPDLELPAGWITMSDPRDDATADDPGFHKASDNERQAFAKEVPAVIAAFEQQLREEAEAFGVAARALTKLAVR